MRLPTPMNVLSFILEPEREELRELAIVGVFRLFDNSPVVLFCDEGTATSSLYL